MSSLYFFCLKSYMNFFYGSPGSYSYMRKKKFPHTRLAFSYSYMREKKFPHTRLACSYSYMREKKFPHTMLACSYSYMRKKVSPPRLACVVAASFSFPFPWDQNSYSFQKGIACLAPHQGVLIAIIYSCKGEA